MRNRMVERVAGGQPAFGGLIHVGDISGARRLGESDLDFVVLDMEHEGFDFPQLGETLQWLQSRRKMAQEGTLYPGPTPIVRLPHTAAHQTTWIASQALDYGALGLVLPYTETAEEVEVLVRSMRYPREQDGQIVGERRVWPKLAMRYWGCTEFDEYADFADLWPLVDTGQLVLIAMVATPRAMENIEEIAAVPGLSGILFGAKHAWNALGRRGPIDLDHPDLADRRQRVLRAAQRNGIAAGTSISSRPPVGGTGLVQTDFLARQVDAGFQFFLTQGQGRPQFSADRTTER